MSRTRAVAAAVGFALAAAGTPVLVPPAAVAQESPWTAGDVLLDVPERPDYEHDRLATSLQDDLDAARGGPADLRPQGRGTETGTVTVVVEASDAARAVDAIEAAGGTVTDRAALLFQAEVPAIALGRLSDSAGVMRVREPLEMRPQAITAEHVNEIGAPSWLAAGTDGAGVKVAIVDVGFAGFVDAGIAGELPQSVDTDFSRCDDGPFGSDDHGTAVAEIVHDVAPGAEILLVCADDDVEFASALATLAGKGVDVVNGSIGNALSGRGDGLDGPGTPADAVAQLRRQGILYVAAAGNYGDRHYHTTASGDTAPGHADDEDFVDIGQGDVLQLLMAPGGTAFVSVKWDAWPTTNVDLDVYALADGNVCPPTGSEFEQNGNDPPIELVVIENCTSGFLPYGLLVNRFGGSTAAAPRIDFFIDGDVADLQFQTPSGLPEPATSAAVLAVGAHCVSNGANAFYSSRGPTIDERTKPDISGPDSISSATFEVGGGPCGSGFTGTSAAAPSAAGAAALLLDANPTLDVAELQRLLETKAQDAGSAGQDNLYGAGRLRLGPANTAAAPTPQPLTSVAPVRLLDTRPIGVGAAEGENRVNPIGPGGDLALKVTGFAGVPNDATAVVLNVTVTNPTQQGWITVHPGQLVPRASNLNFTPGATVAQHVTATVGSGGFVQFFNSHGNTDLVVDLTGWYGPSGGGNAKLTTLGAPARAFDSRDIVTGYAEAANRTNPLGADELVDVKVAGLGGVPAEATAVVVNLTVTSPTQPGWLTLFPAGTNQPLASSLNFRAGQTVANLVVMPVGVDGQITVVNSHGTAHVVMDVMGYFRSGPGAGYVALDPPTRDLDSRFGNDTRSPLGAGGVHRMEVARYYGVPADALAVLLSVIAVFPTASGWLTVYPGTAALPGTSTLNFEAGGVVPNATIAGLGADGTVAIQNPFGTTQIVSDLAGYFAA